MPVAGAKYQSEHTTEQLQRPSADIVSASETPAIEFWPLPISIFVFSVSHLRDRMSRCDPQSPDFLFREIVLAFAETQVAQRIHAVSQREFPAEVEQ
ncbi:MAG TPA: hypothetical protein VKP66_18660 [Steroidobacteraceae bacterium]|nr:hypothetical protein [Steroidobacteraceae bacterium]